MEIPCYPKSGSAGGDALEPPPRREYTCARARMNYEQTEAGVDTAATNAKSQKRAIHATIVVYTSRFVRVILAQGPC